MSRRITSLQPVAHNAVASGGGITGMLPAAAVTADCALAGGSTTGEVPAGAIKADGKLYGGSTVGMAPGGLAFPDVAGSALVLLADHLVKTGNDVTSWTDLSGNARHFSAAGGKEPTYQATGGPNSQPAVYFNAGEVMSLAGDAFGALTEADIFAVWKFDVGGAGLLSSNCPMWFSPEAGGQELWTFTDNQIYAGPGSTVRRVWGNPALDLTTWHVMRATSTATEYSGYVGAEALYTTAVNVVDFQSTCFLGGYDATPQAYMGGHICYFLMLDHKATAGELAVIKANIASKYGAIAGT